MAGTATKRTTAMATVAILGAGDLGARAAALLARSGWARRIVVTRRAADAAERLANGLLYHADAAGRTLEAEGVPPDLNDTAATAALLCRVRPDAVLHAGIVERWWLGDALPEPRRAAFFDAHAAGWLPVALLAPLRAMAAVAEAIPGTPVVNVVFPDLTNPVLARRGLAPTCGLGNIDLVQWRLHRAAARLLAVEPHRLELRLVAHHHHFGMLNARRPPAVAPLVAVRRDGVAVAAEELPLERVWQEASERVPLPVRRAVNDVAAASAVRVLGALLGAEPTRLHVPGPCGLPGGYPVRAGAGEVELDLGDDFTLAEAVAVNEGGQRASGLAGIEDDGSLVLTEHAHEALRRALDIDLPRVPFDDLETVAGELIARVKRLSAG